MVPASVGGLEALWSPCIVGSLRIVAFIVVTRVLNIINVSLVAGSVKGGDTAANVSQEWQSHCFSRHSKQQEATAKILTKLIFDILQHPVNLRNKIRKMISDFDCFN